MHAFALVARYLQRNALRTCTTHASFGLLSPLVPGLAFEWLFPVFRRAEASCVSDPATQSSYCLTLICLRCQSFYLSCHRSVHCSTSMSRGVTCSLSKAQSPIAFFLLFPFPKLVCQARGFRFGSVPLPAFSLPVLSLCRPNDCACLRLFHAHPSHFLDSISLL